MLQEMMISSNLPTMSKAARANESMQGSAKISSRDSSTMRKNCVSFLGKTNLEAFKNNFPKPAFQTSSAPAASNIVYSDISQQEKGDRPCASPSTLPYTPNTKPTEILPFLYISDATVAGNLPLLQSYNISYVLNVARECESVLKGNSNITYKQIDMDDSLAQSLTGIIDDVFVFIEEARKSSSVILVHCFAGRSRSVALVLAYLMIYFNWKLEKAYDFVRVKRPEISVNLGFVGQLLNLSDNLEQTRSRLGIPN